MPLRIRRSALRLGEYYFVLAEDNEAIYDNEVAAMLQMEKSEYIAMMLERFDCYKSRELDLLFFRSQENGQMALDYIDSMLMISKLKEK